MLIIKVKHIKICCYLKQKYKNKKSFLSNNMNRNAKICVTPFSIRFAGALIGAIGFILIAYRFSILGTALIGIGSVIIAFGEKSW